MYQKKAFNRREQDYAMGLRRKLEEAEARLQHLAPSRARSLALTKLDVLSYLDEIPVCVAYEKNGRRVDRFPYTPDLDGCKPVYEVLPGWKMDIATCREYEHLPSEARDYVEFIEKNVACPIKFVSVGAERDSLIIR